MTTCEHCKKPIKERSTYHPVRMPDGSTVAVHPYCMAARTQAEEARPHVLAFAERVARFLTDSAGDAWLAPDVDIDVLLDEWADAITEAARTGAALPGESEGT